MKFAVPFHFLCCESRAQKGHSTCVMWINVLSKMGLESLTKECVVFSQGWLRVVATDSHCHGTVALRSRTIASSGASWPAGLTYRVRGFRWQKSSMHKMHITIIDI